ncbi:TIGR03790 family protein [bacterium]|nr:MAG: TIGR03790 family protein [bacterium]
MVLLASLLLSSPSAGPSLSADTSGKRVMVIANQASQDSLRLARYYMEKRAVPKENLILLNTDVDEYAYANKYEPEIRGPILDALKKAKNPIDILLFIKGVPIKVKKEGYSVDAMIATDPVPTQPLNAGGMAYQVAQNPYFGKNEPFKRSKYGFYLHSRLDGYTFEDARRLVDLGVAAKPNKGPFVFDGTPALGKVSTDLDASMAKATQSLTAKGFTVKYDTAAAYVDPGQPLAGYAGWGSNDKAFDAAVYHRLKFLPGAIAETFVSTSARTMKPVSSGQSVVTDLIAQGITGVKGYVSEPYTFALARPDILFDRYTSGYTMVESFFMASQVVKWKDLVLGDPLCAPYTK